MDPFVALGRLTFSEGAFGNERRVVSRLAKGAQRGQTYNEILGISNEKNEILRTIMILMRFLQLFSTANAAADDEDVMRRGRGALRHTFTRLVTQVGNYSRCFATKLINYRVINCNLKCATTELIAELFALETNKTF